MPRLPNCRPADVVRALKRGGFVPLAQTGSHLHLQHPVTGRRTLVAIHARELSRPVFKTIIKQAGLTEDEFRKLL